MKVRRCFSFSDTNNTVQLVDDKGCPDPKIMSEFVYDRQKGMAEAKIFSMFKFPESSRVHFQCDIVVCQGPCEQPGTQFNAPINNMKTVKDKSRDMLKFSASFFLLILR